MSATWTCHCGQSNDVNHDLSTGACECELLAEYRTRQAARERTNRKDELIHWWRHRYLRGDFRMWQRKWHSGHVGRRRPVPSASHPTTAWIAI